MLLKTVLFIYAICSLSVGFAQNHDVHQNAKELNSSNANVTSPGICDIEIINDSFDDIRVYGRFDDFTYLNTFTMPHWGTPQYVSLFYSGFCHPGMDFYIETIEGKHKYNGFTPVGKTIKISSW